MFLFFYLILWNKNNNQQKGIIMDDCLGKQELEEIYELLDLLQLLTFLRTAGYPKNEEQKFLEYIDKQINILKKRGD